MSFFQDFLSLLCGSLVVFFASARASFILSLMGGLALAALCWWACASYSRLWNKGFQVKMLPHVLCSLAALITLVGTVIFVALKHAHAAAEKSVDLWKMELDMDSDWRNQTFKTAYDRVKDLGLEDFSKTPPPPLGDAIPATVERSQLECAWTYGGSAVEHFNRHRPFLSSIAEASTDMPREKLREDIHSHFSTIDNHYPVDKAITLVGGEVRSSLRAKLPRVVVILRLQLATIFFLCQLIPFGLVAWAAYGDLKVRV